MKININEQSNSSRSRSNFGRVMYALRVKGVYHLVFNTLSNVPPSFQTTEKMIFSFSFYYGLYMRNVQATRIIWNSDKWRSYSTQSDCASCQAGRPGVKDLKASAGDNKILEFAY